jgi:hypothetical protein
MLHPVCGTSFCICAVKGTHSVSAGRKVEVVTFLLVHLVQAAVLLNGCCVVPAHPLLYSRCRQWYVRVHPAMFVQLFIVYAIGDFQANLSGLKLQNPAWISKDEGRVCH